MARQVPVDEIKHFAKNGLELHILGAVRVLCSQLTQLTKAMLVRRVSVKLLIIIWEVPIAMAEWQYHSA